MGFFDWVVSGLCAVVTFAFPVAAPITIPTAVACVERIVKKDSRPFSVNYDSTVNITTRELRDGPTEQIKLFDTRRNPSFLETKPTTLNVVDAGELFKLNWSDTFSMARNGSGGIEMLPGGDPCGRQPTHLRPLFDSGSPAHTHVDHYLKQPVVAEWASSQIARLGSSHKRAGHSCKSGVCPVSIDRSSARRQCTTDTVVELGVSLPLGIGLHAGVSANRLTERGAYYAGGSALGAYRESALDGEVDYGAGVAYGPGAVSLGKSGEHCVWLCAQRGILQACVGRCTTCERLKEHGLAKLRSTEAAVKPSHGHAKTRPAPTTTKADR
mmetsp:Transcript_26982/g.83527  ORF Transcript_26982/g.83527 Transcript_26982/m.83527 type:complete len:326 (-) Transcript_26982:219-1196(-)